MLSESQLIITTDQGVLVREPWLDNNNQLNVKKKEKERKEKKISHSHIIVIFFLYNPDPIVVFLPSFSLSPVAVETKGRSYGRAKPSQ